jgi:hypothetical protein
MRAVIINYNCKEVLINPTIQSRTHYYSSLKTLIRENMFKQVSLRLETQVETTAICLTSWLQYSRTRSVVSACVSLQRETSFSIFCNSVISTSTKIYIRQVSFWSVSYCVKYSCLLGASSEWIAMNFNDSFALKFTESLSFLSLSPTFQIRQKLLMVRKGGAWHKISHLPLWPSLKTLFR